MMAALIEPDAAFVAAEKKWGMGRLEALVSRDTLIAYRRGWQRWREAIESGDVRAVEELGPKMIGALSYMDSEAEAAGHKPLEPEWWEAATPDGDVLVVTRTKAEASAIIRQQAGRSLTVWSMEELGAGHRLVDGLPG